MNASRLSILAVFVLSTPALALSPKSEAPPASPAASEPSPKAGQEAKAKDVKCEPHGVSKRVCARCNPKLAPVFKSKGDWCEEHDRPESQCVICRPELEKKGIK